MPEVESITQHDLAEGRARIARAGRAARRTGDSSALEAARVEYRAMKLEEYIQRVVDEAPPIDAATRDRLAVLLRGGSVV
jgi:hypothetical protein